MEYAPEDVDEDELNLNPRAVTAAPLAADRLVIIMRTVNYMIH